jgi:hypothetical protein
MRRRRGWIIWGALLTIVGLGTTIVAAAVVVVGRGVGSIDPIAESTTPGELSFDAGEQKYEIMLVRRRGDNRVIAEEVRCEVRFADGTSRTVDGDAGATTTRIANTEVVGEFDAIEGDTTVSCVAEDDQRIHFVVDEPSEVVDVALIVLFVAIGVLLIGVALFVGGILWKRPVTA